MEYFCLIIKHKTAFYFIQDYIYIIVIDAYEGILKYLEFLYIKHNDYDGSRIFWNET